MISRNKTVAVGIVALAAAASLTLGACSSNSSSSSSASPTVTKTDVETKTATATAAPAGNAPCTKTALQAALPSGSTVVSFKCDGGYAAVSAAPEAWPILKAEGSTWKSTGLGCSSSSASSLPSGVYSTICTK